MIDRDCANCKHHTPDGCSSWDCEFEVRDTISRADAIAYIDRVTNSGLGRNKSLDYIHKYISALPSAEAEEQKGANMIKDKLDLIASARPFDVRKVRNNSYEIGAWEKGLVAHIDNDRDITYYYQTEDYEGDYIRYEINAEQFMELKHFCELLIEGEK